MTAIYQVTKNQKFVLQCVCVLRQFVKAKSNAVVRIERFSSCQPLLSVDCNGQQTVYVGREWLKKHFDRHFVAGCPKVKVLYIHGNAASSLFAVMEG